MTGPEAGEMMTDSGKINLTLDLSRGAQIRLICAGALLLGAGAGLWVLKATFFRVVAICVGLVGVCFVLAAVRRLRRDTFGEIRFDDEGFRVLRGGRTWRYRYDDLAQMRHWRVEDVEYAALNNRLKYPERQYRSTDHLVLWPQGASKPLRLIAEYDPQHRESSGIQPSRWDRLRDHIAARLARRLETQVQRDGTAEWCCGVRITRTGVELPPNAERIRWQDIESATETAHEVLVGIGGAELRALRLPLWSPGFWPGYHLLKERLKARPAAAAARLATAPGRDARVVAYTLTAKDAEVEAEFYHRRTLDGRREWFWATWALPLGLIAVCVVVSLILVLTGVLLPIIGASIALMLVLLIILAYRMPVEGWQARYAHEQMIRDHEMRETGKAEGRWLPRSPQEVSVSSAGVCVKTPETQLDVSWDRVQQIGEHREHVFVYLAARMGIEARAIVINIPPRAFDDETARAEFLEAIREWHQPATIRSLGT